MSFQHDKEIVAMLTKYCPICARDIVPNNIDEVASGYHEGFIYVHDDVPHDGNDMAAMEAGVQ